MSKFKKVKLIGKETKWSLDEDFYKISFYIIVVIEIMMTLFMIGTREWRFMVATSIALFGGILVFYLSMIKIDTTYEIEEVKRK